MVGRDQMPLASVWKDRCPQQVNYFSLSAAPLPAQRRNTDLGFLTAQDGISAAAATAVERSSGTTGSQLAVQQQALNIILGNSSLGHLPQQTSTDWPGFHPPAQPEIRHHRLTAALSLSLQTVSRSDLEDAGGSDKNLPVQSKPFPFDKLK